MDNVSENQIGNKGDKKKKWWGIPDYFYLIIVVVMTAIISLFIGNQFEVYKVSGGSMNPTISDGSSLIISLGEGEYEPNDIIVFDSNKSQGNLDQYYLEEGNILPKDEEDIERLMETEEGKELLYDRYSEGDYMVKRIIAVPGDTVSYNGKEYLVNNEVVESDNAYLGYGNGIISSGHRKETGNNVMGKISENDANIILNEEWNLEDGKLPENKYLVMGDNRQNSSDSRYFGLVDAYSIEGKVLASYGKGIDIFN